MGEGHAPTGEKRKKAPRIVRLESPDSPSRELETNSTNSTPIWKFSGDEINIHPKNWKFSPNQNSDIVIHSDGVMEFTVKQEHSTPGVKLLKPIVIPRGSYLLTVVAHSDVASTFFPWAMDADRVRLTPTVHIQNSDEPISVPFKIEKETEVWFGVLSHKQEIGDKCFLHSLHISELDSEKAPRTKEGIDYVSRGNIIPHQSTTLKRLKSGLEVRSEPISTPGAYALVDVEPSSTITLFIRVSVSFPSVAFLYVADANSGKELIRRNVIFESSSNSGTGEPSDLHSSVHIPKSTSCIRVGVLFSTVTKPREHLMTIHSLEVCKYQNLSEFVDESYVLNLEKDIKKFELCNRQANRFKIEITRWNAVDGSSGQVKKDWENYLQKDWTDFDRALGRKAIDKPGAWGYLLSMKEIFEDALEKKHNSIAIFDDDFVFANSFDHGFSRVIEAIGDNWKVIYLGASQWLWDGVELGNLPFYPPDGNTNGTFAVIYHKSVFQEILENINLMDSPFDAGPLRSVVLGSAKGKSYVSSPNLVIANLEKPGIRDSRNQVEFSKRFRWDLNDFPTWFTSWDIKPVILMDTGDESENKNKFITAVTTINRKEYLQNFIQDWESTRSQYNDTLIIADDGSRDGTIEWITKRLNINDSRVVLIRNDGLGIARQTNSIIQFVSDSIGDFDALFMCNDDIRFLNRGWDDGYFAAMNSSGYDHLVYFNSEWKQPSHEKKFSQDGILVSSCAARDAMGCFYTLTADLISKIGYFDEDAFPVRGHSHVDYTLRACRSGSNDAKLLYDLESSNELIGMVMREGYKRTHRTLSVNEMSQITTESSLSERERKLMDESRIFVDRKW